MTTLRQTCRRCGHDATTHHTEVLAWGEGLSQQKETVHGECLAAWCNCPMWLEPKTEAA